MNAITTTAQATAAIEAWPLASVEHFDAASLAISTAQAAAITCVCSALTLQTALAAKIASLLQMVKITLRRLTVVRRAVMGDYDRADPDQESPALGAKADTLDAQVNKLEPFLTVIIDTNEQAFAANKALEDEVKTLQHKNKALEDSKTELSAQLAQANLQIRTLAQELSARAAIDTKPIVTDCLDAPQEAAATTQNFAIADDSFDATTQLTAVAPEAVVSPSANDVEEDIQGNSAQSIVSTPMDDSEEGDGASLADDEEDLSTEQYEIQDLEAFEQYILLEDAATMEWTQANQSANAHASSILSDIVPSNMVGCGPDGLCPLPTKITTRFPKLLAHIQANPGLLLIGASEADIAKLPLEWFAALDISNLSLLERRAINMALLPPALTLWLPEFTVCPSSAQKYMWFRQHLDSLMELTNDDMATQEQDQNDWSDADYLAVAAAALEPCSTKDDDSEVSTASEDEEPETDHDEDVVFP